MKRRELVDEAESESAETPVQMEEETIRSGVYGVCCVFDADGDSVQSNHGVGLSPSSFRSKAKDRIPVYSSQ